MPRRVARSYIPRNNNYQGARARDGESREAAGAREAPKRLCGGDACGVHACGVMYAPCVRRDA